MASSFSANQYDSAFNPSKLQNWTVPKKHKERPSTLEGFAQFIADDRGHLLSSCPRSKVNPWGTFMGTWDMPLKIPPSRVNYTARSADSAERLRCWIHDSPLNSASNGPCLESKEIHDKLSRTSKDGINKTSKPSSIIQLQQCSSFNPTTADVKAKEIQVTGSPADMRPTSEMQKASSRNAPPVQTTPTNSPSPRAISEKQGCRHGSRIGVTSHSELVRPRDSMQDTGEIG
ncbi:protein Flattop [Protopterus annectens]|uniref:protein Flattop n=1 Tax=Protopterus annectens TaxID=7888 RepID=UPI001CF96251|nr:protein Flattop [Protopterus annectens]